MKTYDCFTFFNELDLLEIRLNTLNDVVDYFVLVESNRTHTYKDKPLYYSENKHLFEKFKDKIIHIVVDDFPNPTHAWTNENYQRNCISKGLVNCNDDDIIIVSDLDEIPNPNEIELIKSYIDDRMVFEFSQKLYYYYINLLVVNNWGGTKLCRYSKFKSFSPQSLRMNSLGNTLVENGGWHFSYIGGNEMIKYKLESFAETQLNTDEIKDSVDDRVTNGISIFDKHQKFMQVEIDLSYPKHILDNLEKYNHLIKKQ